MGSEKIFMFGEPSTGGRADLTAILPALMNNNKGSNEINAIMRNSNDILNSVDKHKSILEDCEQIVKDLNPVLAVDKSRDEKIANLEKSVSGINDSIEGLKELILGLNKKE